MSLNKKQVAVGIILLFLVTATVPVTQSMQKLESNIITVDDEPGDADYTSITEAMQHTHPGDIIEVYSGTYYENEIHVGTRGLTLQGVPHERGDGNDTGKPVVTSSEDFTTFFHVSNHDITVTSLFIKDGSASGAATFLVQITGDNCTFSYNNISGGWDALTIGQDFPSLYPLYTRIIGNTIENPTIGISYHGKNGNISENILRGCTNYAIWVYDQSISSLISHNAIQNCDTGILFGNSSDCTISYNLISASYGLDLRAQGAKNISIMLNQFEGCGIGLLMMFKQCFIQVYRNNFMKNSWDTRLFHFLAKKDNFLRHRILDGNYYDSWRGSGSKFILGFLVLFELPFFLIDIFWFIPLLTPWIYCDVNPAQEPYDIGG